MFWSQEEPLAQFAKKTVRSLTVPCPGGKWTVKGSQKNPLVSSIAKLRFRDRQALISCSKLGAKSPGRCDGLSPAPSASLQPSSVAGLSPVG